MKKILYYSIGLLVFAFFIGIQPINALQKEYINSQNVVMDYNLYLKLCDIYSEEYMEVISQERYDILKNSDFSNIEVQEYKSFPYIFFWWKYHQVQFVAVLIIQEKQSFVLALNIFFLKY